MEYDIELRRAEGGRQLVLHDLGPYTVADDSTVVFQGLYAAQVYAHGAVELEGAAAGGHLRVAEDDADLLPQLVDEDEGGPGVGHGGGELAQRLRHEARLQPGQGIAHITLDLRAGDEGGDAIDHYDVDGVGAYERLADLQRLLAGIWLGDQHVLDVDAEG